MNTVTQITQTHFSVFVFDKSNNNPIKRMPVYAEIAVIGRKKQEPVDGSLIVLSIDIPADAPVKQWITEYIEEYIGAAYWNAMGDEDKKTFISKLTEKIKNDFFAMPNEKKQVLISKVIKSLAAELDIPAVEQSPFETIAAYPLGLLATDHVGYLSYDLRRMPQNPYPLFQDQQYAFYVYPMGKENARIDALMQGRITPNVILAKLEIEKPLFEANLKALNLPAMQNPDLADWYLSPGSFAALPSALIGADGCENLFPANFATQEFKFRQVVRISKGEDSIDVRKAYKIPDNYGFGYIDEYKVSLLPIGHSLGEIKYSLPLAPGESVKLAIIDWSRTDVSARTEDNSLKEQLYHNQMRDRAITETATAALREMQSGNSGIDKSDFSAGKAISGAVSGAAAGFAVGGPFGAIAGALIGGASGGLTGDIKGTHSTSTGSRDLASNNVQKLADSFSQASSVLKEYHSTVVTQARHEEKESIQTRTFTNYNHSHTLTILYYEILRHFKLVTEWVNRKPVALLPFDKINFDDIMAFHKPLIEANLLDMSLKAGFDAMEKLELLNIQYKNDGISDPNNPPLPAAPYWEGDMKFKLFEFGIKLHGDNEAKSPNDIKIYVRLTNGSEIPLLYLKEFDKLTENINDSSRYNYDVNDDWSYFILQTDRSVPALNSDPNGETPIIRWRDIAGFQFEKSASIPQDSSNLLHILSLEIRAISTNNSWVQLYPNPTSEINVEIQRDVNWRFAGNGTNIQTVTIIKRPSVRPPMPEKIKTPSQLLSSSEHLLIKKLKNHLSAFNDYYSRLIELSRDINDRAEEFETTPWGNTPQNDNIIDHVEPIALEVFGSRIAYPLITNDKFSAVKLKEIYDNIKSNDPEKNQLALEQKKKITEHDFENLAAQIMQTRATTEKLISFPTKGIFAEGKLGHCNISEEIDNTRYWKWEEHPIPINAPDINPITAVTPQNTQQNVQPTSFPSSTVNIVSPSAAPDPQGLAEALKVLATPNIFRDMSGRQETADLIKKLGDGSIDFNDAVKKAKEIEEKYGGKTLTLPSSFESSVKNGGTNVQSEDKLKKAAEAIKSFSEIVPPKALQGAGIQALQDYLKSLPDERLASNDPNIIAATNSVDIYGRQILDDESKKVLAAMAMTTPGTMTRHIADYCSASLNSQSLLGIVRSDHGNLLKPYVTGVDLTKLEGYIIHGMPGAYAWYQSVQGGKGYIMFQKDGFHGQIPAKGVIDPANEWRAVLAHEIQHARNEGISIYPESWAPTNEFYIDVNKAKDLAASAPVSVWNCIRNVVGELAGRFVNWYVWQEIGHPDNAMVTLPTPESFFKRCFKEVKENLKDAPYDTSGYIKYLSSISDDKLAEQVAVWLEHVAHRCYLFDAVCNPPLKGKNIFLAAASAYKADRTSWKTATVVGEGGIH